MGLGEGSARAVKVALVADGKLVPQIPSSFFKHALANMTFSPGSLPDLTLHWIEKIILSPAA